MGKNPLVYSNQIFLYIATTDSLKIIIQTVSHFPIYPFSHSGFRKNKTKISNFCIIKLSFLKQFFSRRKNDDFLSFLLMQNKKLNICIINISKSSAEFS